MRDFARKIIRARFSAQEELLDLRFINSALVGFLQLNKVTGSCKFQASCFLFFDHDASPCPVDKKKTVDPISDLFAVANNSVSKLASVALVGLPATNWYIGFCCFVSRADHEFD